MIKTDYDQFMKVHGGRVADYHGHCLYLDTMLVPARSVKDYSRRWRRWNQMISRFRRQLGMK